MGPASVALRLALLSFLGAALQIATQATPEPRHDKYAGDAACLSCHRDQSTSYLHTAHHLTSQPANKDSILGSFHDGSNVLMIADPATAGDNPGLYFKMEAKANGFYQTAVAGWPGQLKTRSERMDVVIGSGVRGQSYLYWHGDRLYELPVSYWSDGSRWINSPGYKDGTMSFSRAVIPRCLECHATYIEARSPDPLTNQYDPTSLVTGISCERCHGPGAATLRCTKPRCRLLEKQFSIPPDFHGTARLTYARCATTVSEAKSWSRHSRMCRESRWTTICSPTKAI